jgi:hypothetical protein
LTASSLEGRDRHWRRSVYALDGVRLVLRRRDAGAIAHGTQPPPGLPLANALDCARG